jgi:hypothetical protein
MALTACSSGSPPSTPVSPSPSQNSTAGGPTPTPIPAPGPPTIAITATGLSTQEVTTTVGSRVLFVNNDSRPHELWGGPDHNTRNCPQVDVAGFLVPGQSRESGTFTEAGVCEFHDHTNLGNPAFQGRIIVR